MEKDRNFFEKFSVSEKVERKSEGLYYLRVICGSRVA